jgi:hypothetical protein
MPTGYTAGVVDGTIKTFKDFAKNCMRAFGATIHMRDEPMSKKYEPRVPDDFYYERVEEAKKNLAELDTLPDEHFIKGEHEKIKDDIRYYSEKMRKVKEARERLDSLLAETSEWEPPTEDHTAFKDFMIQQLKETIRHDGDVSYYEEKLAECYKKLESQIDLDVVKKDLRESYENNLNRGQKSLDEEIERCKKSNDWVDQLLKSVK